MSWLIYVLQVLARVCVATRPAISLTEAMTQEQLERLILLAANLKFNHLCIVGFGAGVCSHSSCYISDRGYDTGAAGEIDIVGG